MVRDFYADAQSVAAQVWSDGFPETANAIYDAIEAGFTATEICMAIRWHLKDLDLSDSRLRDETCVAIESLLEDLDRALA